MKTAACALNSYLILVALSVLATGSALSQEFHPAQIGDHEQSVLNQLVVPFGRP